jgi:two-component system, NtrC family, nitrogen regulation sensor histidine kinase NtrY
LALVLTSRVEERVSSSLRELVALARRLQRGEPVGEVRRPEERDLAHVIDAVQRMSEEVQRRELSLRSQEELLRRTLRTVSSAVMVVRPDGSVRFANPSGEELLRQHRKLVLPRVLALSERYVEAAGPVMESVQPIPGQELTWQIGVAGVPFPDGSSGIVAVVSDVTDVVRVDRLQQLTQLARIVAHEIKNPLTPVRLWVQELEAARLRGDPELDQLLAEACEEIGLQEERLRELASSFSNLVALERWEAEEVDVAELVGSAVTGLAILERRGVRIRRDAPEPGTCAITGDRQWLRRALVNLVANSVDALDGEGGEIVIRARCADTVVVEVEDSAGGVPEEQLAQLFNPHFSTTSSGSGLGLALVRQVANRCGGTVSASNGEHGLVVRLELPRAGEKVGPASATMSP